MDGNEDVTLQGGPKVFQYFSAYCPKCRLCWYCTIHIIRVLCKDMRNVSYPNWKAASAIRRCAFNEPFSQAALFLGVRAYSRTSFWAYQAGVVGNAVLAVIWFYDITVCGEWFSYLIFAHRRYLNTTDTERISQFFGFTTLTSEISSRMSSVSSAKSSVVDDAADAVMLKGKSS